MKSHQRLASCIIIISKSLESLNFVKGEYRGQIFERVGVKFLLHLSSN